LQCARIRLALGTSELALEVDAPFHGDTPPKGPPGSVDGLFEYEVVEVFLLGSGDRYLEVELGPFGHYFVLELKGVRHIERSGLPLPYSCDRSGERWTGTARVPLDYLPAGLCAGNAYAIHGRGARRRHLAAHPVGGAHPDFHCIDRFPPLVW
jgi:hypothetical protein